MGDTVLIQHKNWTALLRLVNCKIIAILLFLACLLLTASTTGDELSQVIRGTSSDDELYGTSLGDEIYGGKGDDTIYGGAGADILYGGLGADQFMIDAADLNTVDTIKDFNPDEGDSIVLNFRSASIKDMRIPKELGPESVKLDKNGKLKILMSSQQWLTLIHLQDANLYFEVENESNFIRFVLKKDF
ncbi:hypothetical protein ACU6U9_21145 [Pseudomonas sp. HK3]